MQNSKTISTEELFHPSNFQFPDPAVKKENALKNAETFKKTKLMYDIACALQAKVEKLGSTENLSPEEKLIERNKRFIRYGGRAPFSILFIESSGLFWSALMGELYTGDFAEIIKAFRDGKNDPELIFQNLEKYKAEKIQQISGTIAKINEKDC